MDETKTRHRIRTELERKPTTKLWEIELEGALRGNRPYSLKDDESASEYVKSLFDTTEKDIVDHSRILFRDALERMVHYWEPILTPRTLDTDPSESERYARHLMNLIASFTPPKGFQKVMDFLDSNGHFGARPERLHDSHNGQRLRREALQALEPYYSREPGCPPVPYKTYVRLLEDLLEDVRYSGYAAGRLINLNKYSTEEKRIKTLIEDQPESLLELVAWVIDSGNHAAVERSLNHLFGHCLHLSTLKDMAYLDAFEAALQACGARLTEDEDLAPTIQYLRKSYNLHLRRFEDDPREIFIQWRLRDPDKAVEIAWRVVQDNQGGLHKEFLEQAIWLHKHKLIDELVKRALGEPEQHQQVQALTQTLSYCIICDKNAEFEYMTLFQRAIKKEGSSLPLEETEWKVNVRTREGELLELKLTPNNERHMVALYFDVDDKFMNAAVDAILETD